MKELDEWKKRIVEQFMMRSPPNKLYRAHSEDEVLKWFGSLGGKQIKEAFNALLEDGIIIRADSNGKGFYFLDMFNKTSEIRDIIRREPFTERAKQIRPDEKYFQDRVEVFQRATERAWPNRGVYYYCTRKDDPDFWEVVIKTSPTHQPIVIRLGSTKDGTSRISRMWEIILKTWKENNRQPILKKWAENRGQTVFGNNRQPSTAAFQLFDYLGEIKEASKQGQKIWYTVVNEDACRKYKS